ncbi:MAG: ATP-binding cassette domain-containing protein [Bacteroidales bacterium]
MIEVRNISKNFEGNPVLNDIRTRFEPGKCNLIIGRSGSGKTVLLKAVVGLIDVDEGEIWYADQEFTRMGPRQKQEMRKQMGMLFQGGALFDSLSVEENVMFPLHMLTRQSKLEKQKRVDFCLDRVHVAGTNDLHPSALSGGMRKRVAIARAMALNPKYLFCDEPNSGLDPETGNVIDQLIREITHEFGMTTLVNTHDMNSVLEIGDRVTFIHEGRIHWEGTNRDILQSDNETLQHFVFATRMAQHMKEGLGQ